jgi:hypothetical protein
VAALDGRSVWPHPGSGGCSQVMMPPPFIPRLRAREVERGGERCEYIDGQVEVERRRRRRRREALSPKSKRGKMNKEGVGKKERWW